MADNHVGACPSRDIDRVVQSQSLDHLLDLRPQFTVANKGQPKIATRGFEPSRSFNQKWYALLAAQASHRAKPRRIRHGRQLVLAKKPVIDPATHDFDLGPIPNVAPAHHLATSVAANRDAESAIGDFAAQVQG